MKILLIEEAKKLPTPRLLTYYKKYGYSWIRKYYCDSCGDFLCEYNHGIEALKQKYTEEREYWYKIKEELNTREHVHK